MLRLCQWAFELQVHVIRASSESDFEASLLQCLFPSRTSALLVPTNNALFLIGRREKLIALAASPCGAHDLPIDAYYSQLTAV